MSESNYDPTADPKPVKPSLKPERKVIAAGLLALAGSVSYLAVAIVGVVEWNPEVIAGLWAPVAAAYMARP